MFLFISSTRFLKLFYYRAEPSRKSSEKLDIKIKDEKKDDNGRSSSAKQENGKVLIKDDVKVKQEPLSPDREK